MGPLDRKGMVKNKDNQNMSRKLSECFVSVFNNQGWVTEISALGSLQLYMTSPEKQMY